MAHNHQFKVQFFGPQPFNMTELNNIMGYNYLCLNYHIELFSYKDGFTYDHWTFSRYGGYIK